LAPHSGANAHHANPGLSALAINTWKFCTSIALMAIHIQPQGELQQAISLICGHSGAASHAKRIISRESTALKAKTVATIIKRTAKYFLLLI